MLQQFGLKDKLIGLTTDNATNNDVFIKKMKEKAILGKDMHFRCFAHILNLSVQALIKPFEHLVDRLRSVIVEVRRSIARMELLEKLCESHDVMFLKPQLDVSTRWNSTFHMIEFAMKIAKPR